jgi:hypothetical protein
MAQRCPSCGLTNPDAAQRCDCGYDFVSHVAPPPGPPRKFPWGVIVAFSIAAGGNLLGFHDMNSDISRIPENTTISFSLTPGIAVAIAAVTFLATLPFAIRGIRTEKWPMLACVAIVLSLLVLPISFYVMHQVAAERHIKFDG